MSTGLDTWEEPGRLYLARGEEVTEYRPFFTGDVLSGIAIPGVRDDGLAMIVAHPCSIRGKEAKLREQLLVAAVRPDDPQPEARWASGHYNRMPLPDLLGASTPFHVARLDQLGLAERDQVDDARRLACLSSVGVNILQQRLVFQLTRLEVPTATFWEAFAHTFEESDLLEEWNDDLAGEASRDDLAAQFERWIRTDGRQDRLRDPQHRAPVRSEMRSEIDRRRATS